MTYPMRYKSLARVGECPLFQRWILGGVVILMAFLTWGCDEKSCQFESDCPSGKSCVEGQCLRFCEESSECSTGNVCSEGRCVSAASVSDCDGGICADGGEAIDGGDVVDMEMSGPNDPDSSAPADLDMGPVEPMPSLDMGSNPVPLDFGNGGMTDFGAAVPSDGAVGGRGFDLTGLYTVSSTVLVFTGGDFEEEQEIRTIVALTRLNGTRYRVESYNLDGVREFLVPNVDFVAPEGAGRYQYEYTRRIPYRLNCDLVEVRFERGRYSAATHGFQLEGGEERSYALDGENCSANAYIVRTDTVWVPLP